MSARVSWAGLKELYEGLRNLPGDLAAKGGPIVLNRATRAKEAIQQGYPRRTGNLADHVKVETLRAGQFGAAVQVKNTAKHAALFESGTQARHTDLGANRGSMPPGNVFVPIVIRERRAMYDDLKELLADGSTLKLEVSGDA